MTSKDSGKRDWTKTIVIGVSVCIILFALFALINYYTSPVIASDLPISIIKNAFIDIDSDGKQDFVKYMEVIINDGTLNPNP